MLVPLDVAYVIGEFMDGCFAELACINIVFFIGITLELLLGLAEDEDVFVGPVPVPCAPTLQERFVDTLPDGFLRTNSIVIPLLIWSCIIDNCFVL